MVGRLSTYLMYESNCFSPFLYYCIVCIDLQDPTCMPKQINKIIMYYVTSWRWLRIGKLKKKRFLLFFKSAQICIIIWSRNHIQDGSHQWADFDHRSKFSFLPEWSQRDTSPLSDTLHSEANARPTLRVHIHWNSEVLWVCSVPSHQITITASGWVVSSSFKTFGYWGQHHTVCWISDGYSTTLPRWTQQTGLNL